MPMLYGEGLKAFARLQEEIIETSDDRSIFAWSNGNLGRSGVLAPNPDCFAGLEHMVSTAATTDPEPFSMTNVGLSIRLPVMPWAMNTCLALLQCTDSSYSRDLMPHARQQAEYTRVGLVLKRANRKQQFVRIGATSTRDTPHGHILNSMRMLEYCKMTPLLILNRVDLTQGEPQNLYGFVFRNITSALFRTSVNEQHDLTGGNDLGEGTPLSRQCHIVSRLAPKQNVWAKGRWHDVREAFRDQHSMVDDEQPVTMISLPMREQGLIASLQAPSQSTKTSADGYKLGSDDVAAINFGFDFDFNPVCLVYHHKASRMNKLWNLSAMIEYGSPDLASWTSCDALEADLLGCEGSSPEKMWSTHGICALRGSSTSGLSAHLVPLNLQIEIH